MFLRKAGVIPALFYTLLLCGCSMLPSDEPTLAPPLKEPAQVVYSTYKVSSGTIVNSIDVTGRFDVLNQTYLYFKVSGNLKAVYTKIGAEVKKGELLAELESDDIQKSIKAAELNLEKAESSGEENINNVVFEQKQSELQLADLKRQYESYSGIEDAISKDTLEELKNKITSQELTVQNLKGKYDSVKKSTELDIKSCRMVLDNLKKDYEATRLIAPESGTVNLLAYNTPGDHVTAFDKAIGIINDKNLVLVYDGDKTAKFLNGAEVSAEIGGKKYKGRVAITKENMPKGIRADLQNSIIFTLDSKPEGLHQGDNAKISLVLDKKGNTIVIPKEFLSRYNDAYSVSMLENGVKIDRSIQVGIMTDSQAEITSGLKEGDTIVR